VIGSNHSAVVIGKNNQIFSKFGVARARNRLASRSVTTIRFASSGVEYRHRDRHRRHAWINNLFMAYVHVARTIANRQSSIAVANASNFAGRDRRITSASAACANCQFAGDASEKYAFISGDSAVVVSLCRYDCAKYCVSRAGIWCSSTFGL